MALPIFGYDPDNKLLYLYADFSNYDEMDIPEAASYNKAVLERNTNKFKRIKRDGHDLITISYNRHGDDTQIYANSFIRDFEKNKYQRSSILYLYHGKEYKSENDLPIYNSFNITVATAPKYPMTPSPTLHENIILAAGMNPRCDYYYQDGRESFSDGHIAEMSRFVKHFTTLDYSNWQRMICLAPRSGPGMIRTIARFCNGEGAIITDEPNIGNFLAGFGKAIEGKMVLPAEKTAMETGAKKLYDSLWYRGFVMNRSILVTVIFLVLIGGGFFAFSSSKINRILLVKSKRLNYYGGVA